MFPNTSAVVVFIAALFVGMLIMLEVGRKLGIRRRMRDPEGATAGLGTLDAAVFGLIGLLIAFSFSGAAGRFDTRRALAVDEANDIATAYLRLDLLPAAAQPELRDYFRRYVDSRLAFYEALPDVEAAKLKLAESSLLQPEIWKRAVAATRSVEVNGSAATSLVLSALNDMIDITTTRTVAMQTHLPPVILVMLTLLLLGGALILGDGMAANQRRSLFHWLLFALLMVGAIFVILDLEYPRIGLIRLDSFDQLLIDVRKSWR